MAGLTPRGRRGVVGWLEEDTPQSPKTEPFDPKKCRPEPNVRPDTFTHHAGDFRGVVWTQPGAVRGSAECLWLLVIDEHDNAYAKGCRRAFDGVLYPEDPTELTERLEDADDHLFAETFAAAAAQLLTRGIDAVAEIDVGGYFASIELVIGRPNMWIVAFRRTKDSKDKPRQPRWLIDSEIRTIIERLFDGLDMDEPSVSYNTLEFPIYDGRPRSAREWLTVVARETIGV